MFWVTLGSSASRYLKSNKQQQTEITTTKTEKKKTEIKSTTWQMQKLYNFPNYSLKLFLTTGEKAERKKNYTAIHTATATTKTVLTFALNQF